MMKVEVVTTFSNAGYECYGKRFLETLIEHEQEHSIVAYHESQPLVEWASNLSFRNLDYILERRQFLEQHGGDPGKVGTARDYTSQAIRFCHKVFALTDAAQVSTADWLVWVDADVFWTKKPDWSRCLPEHALLSFLGRPRFGHSECGFVGYRVSDVRVKRMLEDMRRYYTSDEIFTRPKSDWHDSRCFDICRLRSNIPPLKQHNLAALHPHLTHVWPHTVLADFSVHSKGPRRKRETYGSFVP